jgi:hypothetical protein
MSATSIQFIGLFVVMMNGGAGLHILLPHFPGTPFADHTSVIQYDPNQVASTTWPGTVVCGPNNSLRCAPINVETIRFSGATDPPPIDIIGTMPHLRCCCTSMTDILATYKDPNATTKLSAHLFVDRGIARAITGSNGRIDTSVTMHSVDPAGITLTGDSSFTIVFKPGASLAILNSMPASGTPHFLAYYLMGVGSSACDTVPSDGLPCAGTTTDCSTTKVTAKAVARNSKPRKKRTAAGGATTMEIDVDCSNSHWP